MTNNLKNSLVCFHIYLTLFMNAIIFPIRWNKTIIAIIISNFEYWGNFFFIVLVLKCFWNDKWLNENQYFRFFKNAISRRFGVIHTMVQITTISMWKIKMEIHHIHRLKHLYHTSIMHIIQLHRDTVSPPAVCQQNSVKNWSECDFFGFQFFFYIPTNFVYPTNRNVSDENTGRLSPERPSSPVLVPGILKSNVAFFENLRKK